MNNSAIDQVRTMALLLLKPFKTPEQVQIRNAVSMAIAAVSGMQTGDGENFDQEAIARDIEAMLDIWVGDGTELLDPTGHEPWLPEKRSQIRWNFWRRYEQYLEVDKGRPQAVVTGLDSLTDKVLENLEDPTRRGSWDRRGMVVGQVQSGKTAHYTGLICKAVDAGYKLIIVLAGVHNSLRSQTQLRLDEEFLGRDSQQARVFTKESAKIGVGCMVGSGDLPAHSLTTSAENGDFNKIQANAAAVYLGSDPVILVVKKNGSVLKNLLQWVRTNKGVKDAEGRWHIKNLPLLMLDDEADNASVHTGELDREQDGSFKDVQKLKAINRLIRTVLNTFDQSAYVGYTATPFANIFIHHQAPTKDEGHDLFPRSFIINLPAPSNYIGPAQVFGTDAFADAEAKPGLPIVRIVDDAEVLIPSSHKPGLVVDTLPTSLQTAVKAFILSCAGRASRGQSNVHNSMLIHVTRFNDVQRQISDLVKHELRILKNRLEYGDGDRNPTLLDDLKQLWDSDYAVNADQVKELTKDSGLTPITWSEVETQLKNVAHKIDVRLINGTAGDVLNYYDHPNGINTIAIGGDKLSRGLTLEGLTVSYYLRASRMYDTLMQMGRWFGYRPGYADLCRLYTTEDLVEWYEHITIASEELRQEFERMADAHLTPEEYGLKVQTHSGGLTITSAGKMRYSRRLRVSFDNQLIESYFILKSKSAIDQNFNATDAFIRQLQTTIPLQPKASDYVWVTTYEEVVTFLDGLVGHPGLQAADPRKLAEYINKKANRGELINWTVMLDNKGTRAEAVTDLGGLKAIGMAVRTPPENTENSDTFKIRNRHIISMSDQMVDLLQDEIATAYSLSGVAPPKLPGGRFIRQVRSPLRGLLMLYALNPAANGLFPDGDERKEGHPIIGYAISFPGTADPTDTVEYQVNSVYLDEEMEALEDEA